MNQHEVFETLKMIREEKLDIRTITMGISLLDCADGDIKKSCRKIREKIVRLASRLAAVGDEIEESYGVPIINKRVAVTPIALVAESSGAADYGPYARALEDAAAEVNVNFIGGFSALVHKGMTPGDRALIASIPRALASTERVCASVNVATSRSGINMDAIMLGRVARYPATKDGEAWDARAGRVRGAGDNLMAGAFHGPGKRRRSSTWGSAARRSRRAGKIKERP